MRQWWRDKDYLEVEGETILPESLSEADLLKALMLAVRTV
jgi:hypothetical protein